MTKKNAIKDPQSELKARDKHEMKTVNSNFITDHKIVLIPLNMWLEIKGWNRLHR